MTASPSPSPVDGWCSTGPSTCWSACPSAAPRRLCALGLSTGAAWASERRSLHFLALLETLRSGAPPFRLALLESATGRYGVEDVREEHLRAIASHLSAWLTRAPGSMADRLTDLLVAPAAEVDASSWRTALGDAKAMLARLAVRRAGAGPFRVTDHEVRIVLSGEGADGAGQAPFAWSARTARRGLGLAAVRVLVSGGARSPARGGGGAAGGVGALGTRGQPVRLASSTAGSPGSRRRAGPRWASRR